MQLHLRGKNGLFEGSTQINDGHITYFDDINSSDKAYFLGFFAADAAIDKSGRSVSVALKEADAEVLHNFLRFSEWKTEVKTKKHKHPQKVIRLASTHLVDTLRDWGLTNNKSKTLRLEKPVPDLLVADFLRGLWDGDGWIGERQFSLCTGSEVFVNQVKQMILSQTGVLLTTTKPSSKDHFVLHGGRNTSKAIQYIYSNPSPVLERKAIRVSRFWV